METRQALRRPLAAGLSYATSRTPTTTTTTTTTTITITILTTRRAGPALLTSVASRRHESTTARTKKRLNIPPHPDFLTPMAGQNHILYNPPSSTASVYHTPFKFLPKSDPRRQANLTQRLRSSTLSSPPPTQAGASSSEQQLPPVSHSSELRERRYNVTRQQVEEMRALRLEDPAKWSVVRLAEKFDCTPMFVMICCHASREHQDRERERLEAIKARWGPIRTKARQEREKRKTLLYRGAL